MICLGVESTCHTLGIAIVDDEGKILANERSIFTTETGGLKPGKIVEHHILMYEFILKKAVETLAKQSLAGHSGTRSASESGIKLKDIDLVSFSQGPGLGGCLRIGAAAARALATYLKVPLIGVNHPVAHVEIGKLTSGFKDPITLYVSGANTQILALAAGRYRVFGETLDIGVGNFLDSFGRALGLGFPQGPKIEDLASKGKKYVELPYTIKGMDFSFSGILTKLEQLAKTGKYSKEDLCYSTQETVFAILTEATERAIAHINKKEILLTGGVAANKRLAEMLSVMAKERGVKFAVVPKDLAGDNAVMIAWLGILEHKSGRKPIISDTIINQDWRTDQVEVKWA
jgi:N6-L-threonylcarbamoyladenine synthase